jgi:hypothetical protein
MENEHDLQCLNGEGMTLLKWFESTRLAGHGDALL